MKRQNWVLGVIISLGISLIGASPRLIRMDKFDISFTLFSIFYNFIFCISCWLAHQFLLWCKKTYLANASNFLFGSVTIVGIGSMSFFYDWTFTCFTDNLLQLPEIAESKRKYLLLLRGLLISGLYYFITYHLYIQAEKQKTSLEVERLKQAQLAANLSSLKEQISPHFLFNTLNTLSSLTSERVVKEYVAELANVYRYVLRYKDMDTATLEDELTFIESYLYIIKTRLENAISINLDVEAVLLPTKIPPLTLQLLIENAVKHNIASASRQLRIDIYNSGKEYLTVCNNFQPKSSVQCSTGIGLGNVMQRYHLLFNKEILIEKTDTSFTVKLPIV